MSILSFISLETLSDFMDLPQDLSYDDGKVYEQFGEYKINVTFEGITTANLS
jgi:hypothetical protein